MLQDVPTVGLVTGLDVDPEGRLVRNSMKLSAWPDAPLQTCECVPAHHPAIVRGFGRHFGHKRPSGLLQRLNSRFRAALTANSLTLGLVGDLLVGGAVIGDAAHARSICVPLAWGE